MRCLDSPPERMAGWPPKASGNDICAKDGVFEMASSHSPLTIILAKGDETNCELSTANY